MEMTYWFGTSMNNLLFHGYNVTSVSGMVATCFGLASLAILLEAMRVLHALLKIESDAPEEEIPTGRWCISNTKLRQLFAETTCYVFESIIGFLVMLCVMTYNAYFTIAVSCGAALGYLLFGPRLLEIRLNARNMYWKKNASVPGTGQSQSAPPSPSSIQSRDSLSEVAEGLVAAIHHSHDTDVPVEVHRAQDQGASVLPPVVTSASLQVHSL